MKPNACNFCGGNFQDWLEVFLLAECNARCSWCIEKGGFRPKSRVSTEDLAERINSSGKSNIILLGGEPTLYPELKKLISLIPDKKIYITTNGTRLTEKFVEKTLIGVTGINISIHSYKLEDNKAITGKLLDGAELTYAIHRARDLGIQVRLNCNLIKGYIDSWAELVKYVEWAKIWGAHSVRFAELKMEDESFIDAAKICNYRFGLNDDPFTEGCHKDDSILGFPVSFRQMCGLQTPHRTRPENPEQDFTKSVLYYDGVIYDGWQRSNSVTEKSKKFNEQLESILNGVEAGGLTFAKAKELLDKLYEAEENGTPIVPEYYGCRY